MNIDINIHREDPLPLVNCALDENNGTEWAKLEFELWPDGRPTTVSIVLFDARRVEFLRRLHAAIETAWQGSDARESNDMVEKLVRSGLLTTNKAHKHWALEQIAREYGLDPEQVVA